jgi:hypothetical protein
MPRFDDLIEADVPDAERSRLQHVHELLVAAGPPPELSPRLEAGPTLAMTLSRPAKPRGRRIALLAATLAILAVAFVLGYVAGNRGGGLASAQTTMQLSGTHAAPAALAALKILPADTSGNWPMKLTATGLPKLGRDGYYEVFLVRNGKIYAPCGSFVSKGNTRGIDVTLNAPYDLQPHDTWIVTKQKRGDRKAGTVVLRPTT